MLPPVIGGPCGAVVDVPPVVGGVLVLEPLLFGNVTACAVNPINDRATTKIKTV